MNDIPSWGKQLTPIIAALGKPRQEHCLEFEATLGIHSELLASLVCRVSWEKTKPNAFTQAFFQKHVLSVQDCKEYPPPCALLMGALNS